MNAPTLAEIVQLINYSRYRQYASAWLICIIVGFFVLISPTVLKAGTIGGIIVDSTTTDGLHGATVRLEGTTLGKISGKDGRFVFKDVPEGTFRIVVNLLGYVQTRKSIAVKNDDSVFVEIKLTVQAVRTNEVVVSANRRLQAVQDVPMSVSVVNAASIAEHNATKLDEVLRYVPGVNVAQGQVNIRGASGFAYGIGSRTMLLLDNFPLLSADNGDISFDALPMFVVDRIEIVKGAGSALYGTSALGGVINVLTREPDEQPETRLRAYSGWYTRPRFDSWVWTRRALGMNGIDAGYSRSIGSTGIILTGGIRSDDSYMQFNDSFRGNLFAKLNVNLNTESRITVFSQYAYEDRADWVNWRSLYNATQPPSGTDLDLRVHSSKFAGGLEYKKIINENSFTIFRSSYYRTWYSNTLSPQNEEYLASTAAVYNAEGQYTGALNKKILLTTGMSITGNDVVSPQTDGNKLQLLYSGYGQLEFSNLDDIIVTMGGRLDLEKTKGENKNLELSPKLGISYRASTETNIRMSAGRAFRAPTVMERYSAIRFAGFTVSRNINLHSEQGWVYELGGEQTLEILGLAWSLDVALFQSELYGLIEPTFDTSNGKFVIVFKNVTRARIQGAEAGVKGWLVDKVLGVESSLTAMSSRNITPGEFFNKALMFRHNLMWTSRAMLDFGAAEIQLDYRYLSRQEEVDDRLVYLGLVANGDIRVPVHVVDARFIYDFAKREKYPFKVTLNIRNLFDYYYVEIPGNLAPIRSLTLQIEAGI